MPTNTINTTSTLNGIKIGGISLSVALGAILVWSTMMTNRANKKLMFQQSSKLTKEGFPPQDDLLDKAFEAIQNIGHKPASSTSSADGFCAEGAEGYDAMNVETWGNPARKNLPIYGG